MRNSTPSLRDDKQVIFAFHGYPWLIHRLAYRRTNHENFHVRGYMEEGTTTTPFDMCVLNGIDRFDLASDVIDRVPRLRDVGAQARERCGTPSRSTAGRPGARRGSAGGEGLAVVGGGRARHRGREPPAGAGGVKVLIVNAGSSSLKLSLLDDDGAVVVATTVDAWQGAGHLAPLRPFLEGCGPVDAVGHRVVHGGLRHAGPERVDEILVASLYSISNLAPLHNPRALAGIRAAAQLLPDVPAVACFDTTFHATLPPAAFTYALPRVVERALGVAPVRLPRAVARPRRAAGCRDRRAGRPPTCGSLSRASGCRSLPGSGTAAGCRWTPRWGSPRWRDWS